LEVINIAITHARGDPENIEFCPVAVTFRFGDSLV